MKKLIAILLSIAAGATLYALPIGNPWDASLLSEGVFSDPCCETPFFWSDCLDIRFGYYGDYVFNRHMEIDDTDKSLHEVEIFTNAAYLALNICHRLDFFASLGTSEIDLTSSIRTWGTPLVANQNEYVILETETDLSWSLGLRGTIWQCGCFALGVEGQYFYSHPYLNYVRQQENLPFYLDGDTVKYQEWQVGLGAAYRINICCTMAFIPYVGVKWAGARMDFDDLRIVADPNLFPNITLFDLVNERSFGYAIGVTLVGNCRFSLTGEARFLDETAFSFNAQIQY